MPFTLAHSAAALPFRRFALVPSALVIGTLAPDFEYFLRLSPDRGFGHTLLGACTLTLPLSLAILWIFHTFVKRPAAMLLPDNVQSRLANHLDFDFQGTSRFSLIIVSAMLGIVTHLLWDSFTHPRTWAYERWAFLRETLHLPVVGFVPSYKLLQHSSTLVGTVVVIYWIVTWYRGAGYSGQPLSGAPAPSRRPTIAVAIVALAFAGAISRAIWGTGLSSNDFLFKKFCAQLLVTAIALVWWQLVLYGLFSPKHGKE